MEKGLGLEVEREVDVVRGGVDVAAHAVEHAREDLARAFHATAVRHRAEELVDDAFGDEPLPEPEVPVDVVVEPGALSRAKVPPGIAGEQLVAAGTREHDLPEAAGELRRVEVRVALPDARLLDVAHDVRHGPLHVAGLQHHLVLLGAEQVRDPLGLRRSSNPSSRPDAELRSKPIVKVRIPGICCARQRR